MADERFEILSESTVYKRYIEVKDRTVRFPDGREIVWDVAYSSYFTLSVAFHSSDRTFTLIREYCQGPNGLRYAWAGGKWEREKTHDLLDSAKAELSEEAGLKGGEWISLLPEGSNGIAELKWSSNLFHPYLVLDPIHDPKPGKQDAEEYIKIHRHVPIRQLRDWILAGEVMLPSVQAAVMAIACLRQRGVEIDPVDWL